MEVLHHDEHLFILQMDKPYKAISSAMIHPGIGFYKTFVNRTVLPDYYPSDATAEYRQFLEARQIDVHQTLAMMTAVDQSDLITAIFSDGNTTLTVLLTAGLGNAVDVTKSQDYTYRTTQGTINIFVFIEAQASDEAMMQAYNCVLEAKTKVLIDKKVLDKVSGTVATGTSTDSIAVAFRNEGEYHEYGGSITRLGSLIGKGVAETLAKAVDRYNDFIRQKASI